MSTLDNKCRHLELILHLYIYNRFIVILPLGTLLVIIFDSLISCRWQPVGITIFNRDMDQNLQNLNSSLFTISAIILQGAARLRKLIT